MSRWSEAAMLDEISKLRASHDVTLDPRRSALVIVDMQRYFLEDSSHAFIPAARAIVPRLTKLIQAYSQHGLPIVFTRHLNTDANAGMMSRWWQDLIRADDPASEIIPEFDLSQGVVIEKSQYDAFYETALDEMLREKGVTQIVICGVMSHLCCETTARSAFVRGFEVFFTVDGTATYTEAFHRATLLNLAHGFAVPVFIDEVLSFFSLAQGENILAIGSLSESNAP
ncbi:isochorismatase family protein [Dehalococcoidia bacterium]|nr:isochorismatase family protein [Dehalococcoidia bacterium]